MFCNTSKTMIVSVRRISALRLPNDRGNAAATGTPAIVEDETAARVHPLVRRA